MFLPGAKLYITFASSFEEGPHHDVNTTVTVDKNLMAQSGIIDYIRLLRPRQWLKNGFVILPLVFGGRMIDGGLSYWLNCLEACVAFCLAASSIYCINDVIDCAYDSTHPVKRERPVASGRISRNSALVISVFAIVLSLSVLYASGMYRVMAIIGGCWGMNIAYCLWLKYISIIDMFIIATGFVMRVFAGGIATGIPISPWMVCLTFILTLLLVWAKRREDVATAEASDKNYRRGTEGYNLLFMNCVVCVLASVTIVCYMMFTLSADLMERLHSEYVYLTSIFVIAGIIRYMQIVFTGVKAGEPTRTISSDPFIITCLLLWGVTYLAILYV